MIPHVRLDRVSYHDRDNFVRNLVTILLSDGTSVQLPTSAIGSLKNTSPLSASAASAPAVLTLVEIKLHCRVEPTMTDDDPLLLDLEMAAHLHVENLIRRTIDAAVGENIKLAMLLLIAHWYRNRESIITGTLVATMPHAVEALLAAERDYPLGVY